MMITDTWLRAKIANLLANHYTFIGLDEEADYTQQMELYTNALIGLECRDLHQCAGELLDAIDNFAEDIGGSRPQIEIVQDVGPAWARLDDAITETADALLAAQKEQSK